MFFFFFFTSDFVTVNENATDAPVDGGEKDTLNGASSLAIEGTYVVRNYSQQVLKEVNRILHSFIFIKFGS